jgi:AcrR family transcriptional regulator
MPAKSASPVSRMSAPARREQVLAAATRAFARTGYAGTSTDVVAREAGVSQPYVVRMFGSKRDLFLAVFERSTDRIRDAFGAVLEARTADRPFDPESEEDWSELGAAYTALLADRDFLLVMMHGFAAGDDDAIGARARVGMAEIFEVLRATGCDADRATAFVAHGMLLNVMLSMRAPEHLEDSPALADLTACAFGVEGLTAAASSGRAQASGAPAGAAAAGRATGRS